MFSKVADSISYKQNENKTLTLSTIFKFTSHTNKWENSNLAELF